MVCPIPDPPKKGPSPIVAVEQTGNVRGGPMLDMLRQFAGQLSHNEKVALAADLKRMIAESITPMFTC